jgi:Asp-tRNA(Asn)/Glu-tRNA(Gln) amidotransferase C subunit
MPELTPAQVLALAEAVRLPVSSDDLAEVTHRLNAFLDALAQLADLPLERVEPLPMLPDVSGPEAGVPPQGTP